jgi:Zn-dependent protease
MPGPRQGSLRLFRFSGIDVFIHWSWFLVAVFEIQDRARTYSSVGWNVAEYLALFLIVTIHEFGHALACRQVGGRADRIVLWPLGGVAYVDPPPRPGATLWSIAAGPLVNVALMPVLYGLSHSLDPASSSDAYKLVFAVQRINFWLFCFNILPIYPLDGGQILRSLLWFVLGRARSLMVATILGFLGVVGFFGLAFLSKDVWLGAIAIFMLMNCWSGLQHARALLSIAKLPRRDGFACPACKMPPPVGECWRCARCGQSFDMFQTGAICPHCSTQYRSTPCLECGQQHALQEWAVSSLAPTNL